MHSPSHILRTSRELSELRAITQHDMSTSKKRENKNHGQAPKAQKSLIIDLTNTTRHHTHTSPEFFTPFSLSTIHYLSSTQHDSIKCMNKRPPKSDHHRTAQIQIEHKEKKFENNRVDSPFNIKRSRCDVPEDWPVLHEVTELWDFVRRRILGKA